MAYACSHCNWMKGTDVATYDITSQRLVPLFNPRSDRWADQFECRSGEIVPLTPVGVATVRLLRINDAKRIGFRSLLAAAGRHPRI